MTADETTGREKMNTGIRAERNINNFSRGRSVVLKIQRMWQANTMLPGGSNDTIDARIEEIRTEFDLTIEEWHYWCRIARDGR